jgi:hypothetical protein
MGLSSSRSSSSPPLGRAPDPAGYRGHPHFWHRALSRRGVVRVAGGLALAGLAGRAVAQDTARATPLPITGSTPKPITSGGFEVEGEVLHVYDYLPGNEPSTIGDFRGLVAINHLQGEGTVTRGGGGGGGISTPSATGDRLVYDADMRVMKGLYVGEDGQEHQGTFGFI